MKHFEVGHEVILTKEYNSLIRTPNREQCYKYSNFIVGNIFTIIKSEDHGFILQLGKDKFFFSDDFMQEYFDIKTNINQLKINDDFLEFIENCCPTFERGRDGKLKMFSCPTQWISGDGAKELLDAGVKAFKEVGANISYFEKWKRDLVKELENEPVSDEVYNLTKEELDKMAEYMRDRYFELLGVNKI